MVMPGLLAILLYIIILILSWPSGLVLSWLCADELVKDRRYLIALAWVCVFIGFLCFFFYFRPSVILSLSFMILVLGFMIHKSYDTRFIKKYK